MPLQSDQELHELFVFMTLEMGLALPYKVIPNTGGDPLVSGEAAWNAYPWNPPAVLLFHTPDLVADPDASARPTWAALADAYEFFVRFKQATTALQSLKMWVADRRTEQIRSLRISLSSDVFPGHRIESIPNLVALSQSGEETLDTPVFLLSTDGQSISITARTDLVTYVAKISAETNRLHNVSTTILGGLYASYAKMKNRDVDVVGRTQAAQDIIDANWDRENRYRPLFTHE